MHCCCNPLHLVDIENDDDYIPLEENIDGISHDTDLVEELLNNGIDTNRYKIASHYFLNNIGYPYIKKYYRINYNWKECLQSLFFFHNDTVNVWSHLISALIFIGLIIYRNIISDEFLWVSNFILVGSIVIFFISTTCHLFTPLCRNIKAAKLLFLLDYVAIITGLIIFETSFFYLLLINQNTIFDIVIAIISSLNCIPLCMRTYFTISNKPKFKTEIINYFVTLMNIIIFVIVCSISETHLMNDVTVIVPFIFSNLIFIGSLIFNLTLHYPEKKIKNKFDLCGASHQIWHFIVSLYLFSIYLQVENWEKIV